MTTGPRIVVAFVLFVFLLVVGQRLQAQGTAFSYQGRLQSGSDFPSGSYDLRFSVWTDSTGGAQIGSSVTNAATSLTNGMFAVALDFGADVWDGSMRWLEIGVRTNGGGLFTRLNPRQNISAAPYAIYAGAVPATGISGTIPGTNIASGTIAADMLAPGAAAANLAATGQSPVPSGAMVLSPIPNATNLTTAGYIRFGGQLDLAWQSGAGSLPPSPRGGHTAVWTGSKLIVWGGTGGSGIPLNTGGNYDSSLSRWTPVTTNNAPGRRDAHTAIWTGHEMVVWGGFDDRLCDSGGRYNPASDVWSPVTTNNGPALRRYHSAVWTGRDMIIWGGIGSDELFLNTGARYSPATDSWSPISTNGAPSGRFLHTAIWSGSEMIVWGGFLGLSVPFNDGARYNPATDTWSPITMNHAPVGRYEHTAVWTGREMLIWGGRGNQTSTGFSSDGARYNPVSDTWSDINNTGSPRARSGHTAVWTGSEMIVWAGTCGGSQPWLNTGGRYSPANDEWQAMTTSGAPDPRQGHTAVWSGSEMIIFGGYNNSGTFGEIYAYAPSRVMYLYLRP
jgi:N-acetylneuraminic acid mutarotase